MKSLHENNNDDIQILFYITQYSTYQSSNTVCDDTAYDGGVFHSGVDTIPDTANDLVHFGVVYIYEYVNAYHIVQLLLYNLQGFNGYNNEYTYDVTYKICVFNNNDYPSTGHLYNNNGTPGCMSGVENDCSGIVRYGNNNNNFIDIYGVLVVYLAYNSVTIVATLETISSLSGQSFIHLSSELAPVPSL